MTDSYRCPRPYDRCCWWSRQASPDLPDKVSATLLIFQLYPSSCSDVCILYTYILRVSIQNVESQLQASECPKRRSEEPTTPLANRKILTLSRKLLTYLLICMFCKN